MDWYNPFSWVTSAADSAIGAVLSGLVQDLADACASLINWLFTSVAGIQPNTEGAGFRDAYASSSGVALMLAAGFLIVALGWSAWRSPVHAGMSLARFGLTVVFMGAVPGFAHLVVLLGDAITAGISAETGESLAQMMSGMITASAGTGNGRGFAALVLLFACLAALFLAIVFWARAVALYLLVFFMPFGIAAGVWKPTAGTVRHMIKGFVGFVLIKPVVMGTIYLGARLTVAGQTDGLAAQIAGLGLLGLACFVPFAIFPMLQIAEIAAAGHGVSAGADAARSGGRAAKSAGGKVVSIVGTGGGGAAAAGSSTSSITASASTTAQPAPVPVTRTPSPPSTPPSSAA